MQNMTFIFDGNSNASRNNVNMSCKKQTNETTTKKKGRESSREWGLNTYHALVEVHAHLMHVGL